MLHVTNQQKNVPLVDLDLDLDIIDRYTCRSTCKVDLDLTFLQITNGWLKISVVLVSIGTCTEPYMVHVCRCTVNLASTVRPHAYACKDIIYP